MYRLDAVLADIKPESFSTTVGMARVDSESRWYACDRQMSSGH